MTQLDSRTTAWYIHTFHGHPKYCHYNCLQATAEKDRFMCVRTKTVFIVNLSKLAIKCNSTTEQEKSND